MKNISTFISHQFLMVLCKILLDIIILITNVMLNPYTNFMSFTEKDIKFYIFVTIIYKILFSIRFS